MDEPGVRGSRDLAGGESIGLIGDSDFEDGEIEVDPARHAAREGGNNTAAILPRR